MNFDDLKRKAAEAAIKIVSSDQVRSVLDNEQVQEAVRVASETGTQVADELRTFRDQLREQMAGPAEDDTRDLKRQLDALRRQDEALREEEEEDEEEEGSR